MHWYCLHTRPFSEAHAAHYLRTRLGLDVYLPRLRQLRVIRRTECVVTTPLFPRYLFCRIDEASGYNAVRYAPDVVSIVAFGAQPTPVPDAIIAELRAWAGDGIDVITLLPDLGPGAQVEITDGPLSGLRAVITSRRPGSDRVDVLLSILDCGARATVRRSQLQLVA